MGRLFKLPLVFETQIVIKVERTEITKIRKNICSK